MSDLDLMLALALVANAAFFVAGTHYWLDARQQRRRALAELRTARRLHTHAERAWTRYQGATADMLSIYSALITVWTKVYPGTPFPVPKPQVTDPPN